MISVVIADWSDHRARCGDRSGAARERLSGGASSTASDSEAPQDGRALAGDEIFRRLA